MSHQVEWINTLCYIHTWNTTQQLKNVLHATRTTKVSLPEIMLSEKGQTLKSILVVYLHEVQEQANG